MTFSKGAIEPRHADADIFVGWAGAPGVDRRFLLGLLPLGLAGLGGGAYAISAGLEDPGPGAWLTGATHEVEGVFARAPYPMLRLADASAPFGMRTALIVAEGKCTSALELDRLNGAPVRASGVLIRRRARSILEVPLTHTDWIETVAGPADGRLAAPPEVDLGTAALSGTIMDSKCFFGVMKPARGRTHKACAALCIRGGIPPSYWVRTPDGREAVLLMTDARGGPLSEEILPLVADPVRAEGRLVRVGDLIQFRADASAFRRREV